MAFSHDLHVGADIHAPHPRVVAVSPVGVTTPAFLHELVIEIPGVGSGPRPWYANGITSADWIHTAGAQALRKVYSYPSRNRQQIQSSPLPVKHNSLWFYHGVSAFSPVFAAGSTAGQTANISFEADGPNWTSAVLLNSRSDDLSPMTVRLNYTLPQGFNGWGPDGIKVRTRYNDGIPVHAPQADAWEMALEFTTIGGGSIIAARSGDASATESGYTDLHITQAQLLALAFDFVPLDLVVLQFRARWKLNLGANQGDFLFGRLALDVGG